MDYFITIRCYGTWLHGDERGAVDSLHNMPGEPFLEANANLERAMAKSMKFKPVRLNAACRASVEHTIVEVVEHREWYIHAQSVQTNHVHLVINADAKPEKVMNDFKSYMTRGLRRAGLVDSKATVWGRHGSTRYLWTPEAIVAACRYVVEDQADLSDCP